MKKEIRLHEPLPRQTASLSSLVRIMHITDDMQKNAADKMKTIIENSGKNADIIEFPA